jgi:2-polyprenyl-3-methyl-5-hydroxy-6-metoxy-1,4-benzoquinol methylase
MALSYSAFRVSQAEKCIRNSNWGSMMTRVFFDSVICDFRDILRDEIAQGGTCEYLRPIDNMLASYRFLDRLYADFLEFSKFLPAKARVLDIGTGCGIAGMLFAALGHDVEAIDIADFAEAPDTMAREQIRLWSRLMQRYPTLRFQHYHNNKVPFPSTSFEAVVAYGVIEHIPDDQLLGVMQEIVRVTRPNGHLFISYLPRKWALLEIVTMLMGREYHRRRWGDSEIGLYLARFGYETLVRQRIIFAPQYPTALANRLYKLLNVLDRLTGIPPFASFARDLLVIARISAPVTPVTP